MNFVHQGFFKINFNFFKHYIKMLFVLITECFGSLSPLNLVTKVSASPNGTLVPALLDGNAHKMLCKGPGT